MKYISTLLLIFYLSFCFGQNDKLQAFEAKDSSLFDFWIGQWDLTWQNADGSIGSGTNNIEKTLDGKVIQENFRDTKGFKGTSISVFNTQRKTWHQAWADNGGGFFNFFGDVEGDKKIFKTQPRELNGNTVILRMVFYDIKSDSLKWDWERSDDGGKTWKLNWRINYVRKK
jgi:hypothetical protein